MKRFRETSLLVAVALASLGFSSRGDAAESPARQTQVSQHLLEAGVASLREAVEAEPSTKRLALHTKSSKPTAIAAVARSMGAGAPLSVGGQTGCVSHWMGKRSPLAAQRAETEVRSKAVSLPASLRLRGAGIKAINGVSSEAGPVDRGSRC